MQLVAPKIDVQQQVNFLLACPPHILSRAGIVDNISLEISFVAIFRKFVDNVF